MNDFDYTNLIKIGDIPLYQPPHHEVYSYYGLTLSLQNYYRNKYQDIHDYYNGVEPAINFVKHAKQLLLRIKPEKITLNVRDSVKTNIVKILKKFAEGNLLIIDTTFVQRVLGCSAPTARKYIKLIAQLFKVKTVCPEFLKGQPAKKYRITIFEMIFSGELFS